MKDFADDNLKFEENGRKLLKPVENIVGKGDITSNFSFSQSVFKRLVSKGHQKVELCGNGLKRVENILGKVKNAVYKHFLLFPKCFQKSYFRGVAC